MAGPLRTVEAYPKLSENQQSLPTAEALQRLRTSLPTWRARQVLPPEASSIVQELCAGARASGWTPEQLIVAVKNACYSSEEVTQLDTTSERDALLSRVVTTCIKEYFRDA